MNDEPVRILERLLHKKPGPKNVHYLRASRDFYASDWTYKEMQAIEKEFAREFRSAAAQVEAAWGPPDFMGPRVQSEFPEWYVAQELCYWKRGDRLALIWWEHQDKELPVLLVLAVMTAEQLGS
jgi:hypothetical protein